MESDKTTVDKMTGGELLDIMWQALNKANLKGVFMINESFLLKLVHTRLLEKLGTPSNETITIT